MDINNKSYINKDYQTIYPELVDIVSKLTNVINLRQTNESDPMVVLVKLMAFIADKLNYNVDINTLLSFMPTTTQDSSFRDLADINGYTMQYYKSASTRINIMYTGEVEENKDYTFKPFETTFTDASGEIIYTLVGDLSGIGKNVTISKQGDTSIGIIYEGNAVDFSINNVNTIQLANLDSEHRLFLPEVMIASNIICVKNASSNDWGEWKMVDNLNIYKPLEKKFKFGFDSVRNLPYIEFPDDIEELIENGLNVKYFKTSGASGNIIARRLNTVKSGVPSGITDTTKLFVSNIQSTSNGANIETIEEAYKNFKKTIGTFDVLTTTRDFANYLYRLTDTITSYPLVSNVQVTDRRTDVNLAHQVVTFDEFGTNTTYVYEKTGDINIITPFDLVLYPLQYVNNITDDDTYNSTFTPTSLTTVSNLIEKLEGAQAMSHTYKFIPELDNILYTYLYKNMYSLNCRISTIYKVNNVEQAEILYNVRKALYDTFNAREVEYGKPIEFDDLLETIVGADTRIKNVSLDEPEVTTMRCINLDLATRPDNYPTRVAYNVLAGRVELYEYDTTFDYKFGQTSTQVIEHITSVTPEFTPTLTSNTLTLDKNQVVQLYAQSYGVDFSALVGVNYRWYGNDVDANDTHILGVDETLKISTVTNGVQKNLEYGNGTIIKPNFNLTSGEGSIDIGGVMYKTLGTNEKISFLKPITVTLGSQLNAYWFVNNAKNELFDTSDTGVDEWEHILDENEYFFYTDAQKTQLNVLGSGTKLVTNKSGDWALKRENLVSLETFNSEDISTYGAINWKSITFTTDTWIKAQEQQILTLIEGDSVNLISDNSSDSLTLGNELKPLEGYKLHYVSNGEEGTVDGTGSTDWFIRTRLDLSIMPNTAQQLKTNEKIWYNGDATYIENAWVMSSYPIQSSTINTFTTQENEKLYTYDWTVPTYSTTTETNKELELDANGSYVVSLEGLTSITLNVPNVTDKDCCFMMYIDQQDATTPTMSITNVTNLNTENANEVRVGMNNFVVSIPQSPIEFEITSTGHSGSVIIMPLRVTDIDSANDIFGLDSTELTDVNNILDTYKDIFYYFYPVPNTNAIDVTDYRDANSLWEINDIYNKSTLPQIDFTNSNFSIIKSSRL